VPLALLDATQVLQLLLSDWAVKTKLDQLGVSANGVERCPKLVAHHAQEVALRPICAFGLEAQA
jgi:hypothetical protein